MEKRNTLLVGSFLFALYFLSGCRDDVANTLSNIQKKPAPGSTATRVVGTNATGQADSIDIFPYPLYNGILEQVPQGGKVVLEGRFETDNGTDQANANLLGTKQANNME